MKVIKEELKFKENLKQSEINKIALYLFNSIKI